MDLFTNNENILSSDDDSEDLNYTVISADDTNNNENKSFGNMLHTNVPFKQQEVKKHYQRIKLALMAKKKAIKWLNSKHVREKRNKIVRNIFKDCNTSDPVLPSSPLSLRSVSPSDVGSGKTVEKTLPNGTEDIQDAKDLVIKKEKEAESFFTNPRQQNISYEKNINSSSTGRINSSQSNSPVFSYKYHDNRTAAQPRFPNRPMLLKDVGKLFPKFNNDLHDFVRSSTKTVENIETKISEILMELQILNKMITAKEFEWNKLQHLRKIKEDIIINLVKKKKVMEIRNEEMSKMNYRGQSGSYRFVGSPRAFGNRFYVPSTALSLVERRANMNREDLERETPTINELQRILFAGNLSNSKQNLSNINMAAYSNETSNIKKAAYSNETSDVNINSQNMFKDNRGLNKDYRPRKINIIRKRSVSNELYNDSAGPSNKKLKMMTQMDEEKVVRETKSQFANSNPEINDNGIPFCQSCKLFESRFVCAGCGNQWYCSRRCQVADWDSHHSETCGL